MEIKLDKEETEKIVLNRISFLLSPMMPDGTVFKISTGISYTGIAIEIIAPENNEPIKD